MSRLVVLFILVVIQSLNCLDLSHSHHSHHSHSSDSHHSHSSSSSSSSEEELVTVFTYDYGTGTNNSAACIFIAPLTGQEDGHNYQCNVTNTQLTAFDANGGNDFSHSDSDELTTKILPEVVFRFKAGLTTQEDICFQKILPGVGSGKIFACVTVHTNPVIAKREEVDKELQEILDSHHRDTNETPLAFSMGRVVYLNDISPVLWNQEFIVGLTTSFRCTLNKNEGVITYECTGLNP